jgi:hypothetical protein
MVDDVVGDCANADVPIRTATAAVVRNVLVFMVFSFAFELTSASKALHAAPTDAPAKPLTVRKRRALNPQRGELLTVSAVLALHG